QILGRNALPSKTMNDRYPSEALLDQDDKNLSPDLKMRLRERIRALSSIDVRTDLKSCEVTREVSVQRRDGFLFCRDALLTSKIITYAEQMQGMYTLMDGLTVAFAVAATYHLGWGLSGIQRDALEKPAWIGVVLGLVAALVVAGLGLEKARMTKARLMGGF